jgi:Cdc6-like AAA superfamily ATPase
MSSDAPAPGAGPTDAERRLAMLGRVFTPATPISQEAVFAGRLDQLQQIVDAISQPGVHVVIFGEPGVGKTSLANILSSRLASQNRPVVAPRVNCERTDDFTSLWKRALADIRVTRDRQSIGFQSPPRAESRTAAEAMPDVLTAADVRDALTSIGSTCLLVVIVDEFDRLGDPDVRAAFADAIKVFSDHAVPMTLILVGVADTVEDLIAQHQSVERALVQVRMPRMSAQELEHIVSRGLALVSMSIEPAALSHVAALSQGLPHYTHLLALYAARTALEGGTDQIDLHHVGHAIGKALDKAQHSIKSAYHRATSQRRDASGPTDVLLACALARTDQFGHFTAADARHALDGLAPGRYSDGRLQRHLKAFADPERDAVLNAQQAGFARRFRFNNPLMQPYVILQGVAEGRISVEALERA